MKQKIEFSEWFRWDDRKEIKDKNKPGVYILAIFDTNSPEGKANPKDEHIIYIGETSSTLHKRLYKFNRSAFEGQKGHSGGSSYRTDINVNKKKLYVSIFTINDDILSEKLRNFQIKYIERKLILDFAEHFDKKLKKYPLLNKQ